MQIDRDILENVFLDFQKKNLTVEQKGLLIKQYIEEQGISQREFAKRFNIHHNTVHDWISGRQKIKALALSLNPLYTLVERLLYVIDTKDCKLDDKTRKLLPKLQEKLLALEKST